MNIQDWRQDYNKYSIDESTLPNSPFDLFKAWFDKAVEDKNPEPNAFVLTTCMDQIPSSRVVLLKEIEEEKFVFYTNYDSQKGKAMAINPNVSLLFFWPYSQRQIRIQGVVSKMSREKAVEYFNTRPEQSRISAISSPQSAVITKEKLVDNTVRVMEKQVLDCPIHWGGYGVEVSQFEFWQGQPARLHDRIVFKKISESQWEVYRLAP